ncbi:MAG: RluA family pseudouridine synthase [Acidimicrobiia bacterium]|nr:RluA family pseudouridine synthase [Acidimicrobiia bacterium]
MSDVLSAEVPDSLAGERTDKAVAALAGVSRAVARDMVDRGSVTLDGAPAVPSQRVRAGSRLTWPRHAPEYRMMPDATVPFGVVYEDADLAVISKPAGVVVHRGAGNTTRTLVHGLLARWPHIEGVGEAGRWGIVHRLDRDTSGALVVALTARAHTALTAQIAARAVHRVYTALAAGRFDMATGTIDAPIGRDPVAATRMTVQPEGRPARTHYRRVAEWADPVVTLLEVTLDTGRTHQIRVHLAAIGHAVVGDTTYRPGPDPVTSPRIFLHAAALGFDHPITGARIEVEVPLPDDLAGVVTVLGPSV